jgi:hypothetical protein
MRPEPGYCWLYSAPGRQPSITARPTFQPVRDPAPWVFSCAIGVGRRTKCVIRGGMDRRTLPANGQCWRETRAIRGYAAKGIGCCDASFEESCIRKAVDERGLNSGLVGLADAISEDEAATGTAFALM